jgi:hypothetical protein
MRIGAVLVAAAAAWPAFGQEVFSERSARGQLFNERRVEVQVVAHPFLSPAEIRVLEEAGAGNVPYYGAIAASPDQGLTGEPTSAAGNHHSMEGAAAAALSECNSKRAGGTAPCVIVAEIRPRGWEPRALQLSQGATASFRRDYARASGTRAFAISPSTGGYGIGRGDVAADRALAACNAAAGARDCRVAIAD